MVGLSYLRVKREMSSKEQDSTVFHRPFLNYTMPPREIKRETGFFLIKKQVKRRMLNLRLLPSVIP